MRTAPDGVLMQGSAVVVKHKSGAKQTISFRKLIDGRFKAFNAVYGPDMYYRADLSADVYFPTWDEVETAIFNLKRKVKTGLIKSVSIYN